MSVEIPPEGIRQRRFAAPEGATTILLVRHAESAAAHPDRPFELVGGHSDPPLYEPDGLRQAELLGERLAGERIDAVYVTPLRRTHQTAQPLLDKLGLEATVEPDLREVFLGEWEGGTIRVKGLTNDEMFQQILAEQRWDVVPGAESLEEFAARTRVGLQRIVAAHPGGRVVVVAHGGVIAQLLHEASGSQPFAFMSVDNASISELVVMPDRQVVRRFNDISHLGPLADPFELPG